MLLGGLGEDLERIARPDVGGARPNYKEACIFFLIGNRQLPNFPKVTSVEEIIFILRNVS